MTVHWMGNSNAGSVMQLQALLAAMPSRPTQTRPPKSARQRTSPRGTKRTRRRGGGGGAWRCSGASNEALVHNLRRGGLIKSDVVEAAMLKVDRGNYAPSNADAYDDRPLPIGFGATISAPHMHATALELLSEQITRPNSRVLDVGCGSGYLTAVIARMQEATGGGKTVGIDYLPGLVALAEANARKADGDLLARGAAALVLGDGWRGHAAGAPYDAIHVGAAAARMPEELIRQLRPGGGRMVCPVGPRDGAQVFYQIDRTADGGYTTKSLMGVRYVPLVEDAM
uniref:protein-L-isoaspartate(D-aspartate) O-methyltransferase n=1 Tax=Heterosigma akashiwo TaxID=2829 RepID=A0A7S4D5H4_HETAK